MSCGPARPPAGTPRPGSQAVGPGSPLHGGTVRIYIPGGSELPLPADPGQVGSVLHHLSFGTGLVSPGSDGGPRPGIAVSWRREPVAADLLRPDIEGVRFRWSFQLDSLARFPDGAPVTARDVIEWWQAGLRIDGSPSRWLLEPVVGAEAFVRRETEHVAGLVARDRELVLLLKRETPDLPIRLAHPVLQVFRPRPGESGVDGLGPFQLDARSGRLTVNPYHPRGRPYLDALEFARGPHDDPALLLKLGETDLAVVYGRAAGELLEDPRSRLSVSRLPSWDRTYALWLNPTSRWVNDPSFRWWLSRRIDRSALLRYLFDGRGEPIRSLFPDQEEPVAEASSIAEGPRSGRSRPRLSLLFDAGDPHAATIASRIRADLRSVAVELTLQPAPTVEFRSRLARGRQAMALVAHLPLTPDPLLSLRETLSSVGAGAADVLRVIDNACSLPDNDSRLAGAVRAESLLRADGRLIPVVRLHAWLATHPDLAGVEAGPWGRLSLEGAWWLP